MKYFHIYAVDTTGRFGKSVFIYVTYGIKNAPAVNRFGMTLVSDANMFSIE